MELPRSYRECEPRYSWRTTQHEATSAATKAQPSDSDPGALLDHELGPRFPPPPTHPMVPPAAYAPFHHTHHYPHDRLPPPMYAVPVAIPWEMMPRAKEPPAPPRPPPTEPPTFPRREALSRACAAEPFFPAHMDSRQQWELVHPRWTTADAALGHAPHPRTWIPVRPDTSSSSSSGDESRTSVGGLSFKHRGEAYPDHVRGGSASHASARAPPPPTPPPPPPAEIIVELDPFNLPTWNRNALCSNPFKAAKKKAETETARAASLFEFEGLNLGVDLAGTTGGKENESRMRNEASFGFHDYYSDVVKAPATSPATSRCETSRSVSGSGGATLSDHSGLHPCDRATATGTPARPAAYPHGYDPTKQRESRTRSKRKNKIATSAAEYQPALHWKPQVLTARTNATKGASGMGRGYAGTGNASLNPSMPKCTLCSVNLTGEGRLREQHDSGTRHRENMAAILDKQMCRDSRHVEVAPEWRVDQAKVRIERSVVNMTRQGKNPWVAQKMGFFDGQGWSK